MKTLIFLLAGVLSIQGAYGAPRGIKVTNRQFEDGSGSSKVVDPEKRTAEETFIDVKGRTTQKIVYQLDERMQPIAAAYYTAKGLLTSRATYKLDGADRIVQEIMTDASGKLMFTRNYHYGTRNGKEAVVGVDVYDSQNRLVVPPSKQKKKKK